jgi:hypothetical protein
MVALDESLEGLKPGMSAEVTILVDKTVDDVLIVPVQAIMGTTAMGKKRYCWVKSPSGYEERELEVGASNEKEAEIRSGLQDGEQIVLNYKVLEDERVRSQRTSLAERSTADESRAVDWGKGPSPAAELEKAGKSPSPGAAPGGPRGAEKKAGGVPGGPGGRGNQGPGGDRTPEQQQEMRKRQQEFQNRFKSATPAQRKEMLEEIPEAFREQAKERLKAQGLKIAD